MENEGLRIRFKRKHLLTIILNLIVINRGKQRVARSRESNNFANNLDQQKTRNEDISTDTRQTFANDSNIYLVEQAKKHCHRNGKLEFLIKWLGYSNCQNTWEPEDHLSPALVQEYFQQPPLKKPTPTNAVSMTKILTKEPSVSWRCYIPLPLVLLSLFILWSSLPKALFASVPALNLGPLYDCSPPWHLGMFEFLSLKNCSHDILQQEATTSTFWENSFGILPSLPPCQSIIAR